LSNFSFDDRASGTGPKNFDVQISTNATFASVVYDSGAQSAHTGFTTTPMNNLALSVSNLTGTVYFRIYGYGGTAATGTWRVDNINVQGSTTQSGGSTGGGTGWYIDSVTVSDVVCCVGLPQAPTANFSGTPTIGTEPLSVSFTDTSSGNITNRFWDFGDGTGINVSTNAVSHTYTAGVYTVSLTVSGPGDSSTNVQSSYITVYTAFQAWQIQYFGSTTNPAAAANTDPDGDGLSNLQEFLAGTDPTNGASGFRIVSIVPQGSDLSVTWNMGPGKTNALQVTSGDGSGNFVTNGFADLYVVTNTVGTVTNYTDLGAVTNQPTRYYRVRLVP
jgi:PKD repeat protein